MSFLILPFAIAHPFAGNSSLFPFWPWKLHRQLDGLKSPWSAFFFSSESNRTRLFFPPPFHCPSSSPILASLHLSFLKDFPIASCRLPSVFFSPFEFQPMVEKPVRNPFLRGVSPPLFCQLPPSNPFPFLFLFPMTPSHFVKCAFPFSMN